MLCVAADAVHEVAQVAGGELPAERPGGLVVAVREAQQGGGELFEAVEVVRGDGFLLDDGEEDLGDLVQPRGVQRGVDHDRVRVCLGHPRRTYGATHLSPGAVRLDATIWLP